MNKELTPQKERFLREVEQQLLRRDLDARPLEDGLIHIKWNEKPLCSVDRDGIVRFRPADITGPEVDRQLRTVIQAAGQVKEYMRIFERAPALKAVGLEDTYKVLADFGDAVLAGQLGKKGARFVTWEWDFDRQGVHTGHYHMENYEAAKLDFAVRAGLINEQRLFSDEQLAVIRNSCEFALEDDATLSYAEEKQLHSVQEQIELLLGNKTRIQRFANRYVAAKSVFFIGRGLDYTLSMEGSLKLKEITYMHSEAYAAGELKHGPISLIEDGTLVMASLTQEDLYKKTISNIREVKSRGAFVLALTTTGHDDIEDTADYVLYIPQTNRYFTNSLAIIPFQMFAYYVSIGKGLDVDKPRNLAKSVTVE